MNHQISVPLFMCRDRPNHYSVIYNKTSQGHDHLFHQEDVHPCCTWSPSILGCICYPFISIHASISPIVSHSGCKAAGVLCMIIDGTSACRHSGSDGWWGLRVTEPFPSKIFPRLRSLTRQCGCKPELVQLCVSFLTCDTLTLQHHVSLGW